MSKPVVLPRIDRKIASAFPAPSPCPLAQRERGCGKAIFRSILIGVCACWALAAQAQPPATPPKPAPVVTDPFARDLLATNPTTPADIVRVLSLLIDLNQAKAGEGLLRKLSDMALDDDQLTELDRQYGSGMFLKFSLPADLQPLGKQFADRVLAAANKQARDPAHIAALVERLKTPSASDRAAAITELQRGGDAAVATLVKLLADSADGGDRQAASDALAALGELSIGALAAALEGDRTELAARAAGVLGNIQTSSARQWLLAPALGRRAAAIVRQAARQALAASGALPDRVEAAAELYRAALQYDQQPPSMPQGAGGLTTLWTWDAKSQLPVAAQVPQRLATRELAARLAAAGRDILPDEPELRRLQNALSLEAGISRAGGLAQLDRQPGGVWDQIAAEGVEEVEDLLAFAMAHGHPGPAAVAAEILGLRGSVELLAGEAGKPGVLARAAAHPDRRLRFAAVAAVISLDPRDPYPGSSLVADALKFFMGSNGTRTAVVGDVRILAAQQIAGLLQPLGYDVRVATSNRDLVRQAIAAPDLELVLVDMLLAGDLSGKVVQDLRHDCRTASVPVGLLAAGWNVAGIDEELNRADLQTTEKLIADRESLIAKASQENYPPPASAINGTLPFLEQRRTALETSLSPRIEARVKIQALALNEAGIIARREPRTAAVLRPLEARAMQAAVAALRQLAPEQVPAGERLAHGRQAMQWLAGARAAARAELYPLVHFEAELVAGLRVPALVDAAIPLLAELGTPACQLALVDLASVPAGALATRQAAAAAFGANVMRHGILLTHNQIIKQYDRYNASENHDQQSQAVLAAILDSMEEHAARQAARGPVR
jgi:CheY-like chemotaxis protein